MSSISQTAIFGSGCFWCTEAVFLNVKGVQTVQSGYIGGEVENPTYTQVCSGTTGHAEAIQITFHADEISFETLLKIFFGTHDPTTLNRQGADSGTQYRSAIFPLDDEQRKVAENVIRELNTQEIFDNPIVTSIEPLAKFWLAEDHHQNYYNLNSSQSYCQAVISPKMAKFRSQFADLKK